MKKVIEKIIDKNLIGKIMRVEKNLLMEEIGVMI